MSRPFLQPLLVAAIAASLLAASGCATISRGKTQQLNIESRPTGAKVYVDGTYRGETPLAVMVERNATHAIKVSADGHEDVAIQTEGRISAGYVVADLLFGGVWLIIDAVTGAWNNVGPEPVRVILSPAGQDCSTGACDYLQPAGAAEGGAR